MVTIRGKKIPKKDFYLYLLSEIDKTQKLPKSLPKQNINYYLKPLVVNELVQSTGYATWEITALGRATLDNEQVKKFNLDALVQPNKIKSSKSKKATTKFIRTHGLMWKIKTSSNNKDFIFNKLEKFDPIMTETKQVKVILNGHNIKFGNRGIIVNFDPDMYFDSKTAVQGYKLAVYELKRLLIRLENILGTSLRVKGKYLFKPCKKHFGDVNNSIARHYKDYNISVSVYDAKKEWLVIDFSDKRFIELETTDNSRNIIDMDHIISPFMNKLRQEPKILDKIEELKSENDRLVSLLDSMAQAQLDTQKHLTLAVRSIEANAKTISTLTNPQEGPKIEDDPSFANYFG